MGGVKGQSHIVGPASIWGTSFYFMSIGTTIPNKWPIECLTEKKNLEKKWQQKIFLHKSSNYHGDKAKSLPLWWQGDLEWSKVTNLAAKKNYHTHILIMWSLKGIASLVFPASQKVFSTRQWQVQCGWVWQQTRLKTIGAWQHQTITWTNADLSSVRSIDINLRTILQEMPQPSITKFSLKIIYLKFLSNLPGANELINGQQRSKFHMKMKYKWSSGLVANEFWSSCKLVVRYDNWSICKVIARSEGVVAQLLRSGKEAAKDWLPVVGCNHL